MGERNYVVYKPFPLGGGMVIAVFANEYTAKSFVSQCPDYCRIAEVDVNGSTSIKRYMDLVKETDYVQRNENG